MTCPSLPHKGDWTTSNFRTYGARREANNDPQYWSPERFKVMVNGIKLFEGVKTTKVETPEEHVWYADTAKKRGGQLVQWINFYYNHNANGSEQRVHKRHNDAGSVWFVDGHVSSEKRGDLNKLGFRSGWNENGA